MVVLKDVMGIDEISLGQPLAKIIFWSIVLETEQLFCLCTCLPMSQDIFKRCYSSPNKAYYYFHLILFLTINNIWVLVLHIDVVKCKVSSVPHSGLVQSC
jgi:hypothetical protein